MRNLHKHWWRNKIISNNSHRLNKLIKKWCKKNNKYTRKRKKRFFKYKTGNLVRNIFEINSESNRRKVISNNSREKINCEDWSLVKKSQGIVLRIIGILQIVSLSMTRTLWWIRYIVFILFGQFIKRIKLKRITIII